MAALGGDLDQPVGHVGDALLQPGLARLPGDNRPGGSSWAPSSAAAVAARTSMFSTGTKEACRRRHR